jgi:hypothetical protein
LKSITLCAAAALAAAGASAQVLGGGSRGFQGPAILSRGYGTTGRSAGAPLTFTPYIGVNAFYRTGLTPAATDGVGSFIDRSDYGAQASLGAYLRHLGNHKTVSLDYRTHMRYHQRHRYHFGNDHFLGLSYAHQVSSRISYFLRQSARTFSAGFGQGFGTLDGSFDDSAGFGFANQGFLQNDPLDQVFDTRIYGLGSTAGMVYQKSARLHFGMAGGYHLTRYHSNSLIGSQGARASGSISYSLSERSVIGMHYGFARIRFRTAYGGIDSHQVGMHFSRALTPRSNFSLSSGVFRAEVDRVSRAPLDPLAALLLGESTQLVPFYRKRYGVGGTAAVGRSFERSSISLFYARGITPGNGVIAGANSERAGLSHSYMATQALSLGSHVHYTRHKSMFDGGSQYRSYGAGTGTSYRLFSVLHASIRVDYQYHEIRGTSFSRQRFNIQGGLSFAYTPGAIPLSLW